ncbi:hypothetical protein HPB52_019224 [Rhipicephalus sanguineus]|uniref:Uncharacterized protein n=1 Tax=Rhipicephalus sanguineus TaxID=34632 RepID=A0A9D4PXE6_RHISA|nr:hypothetical protein HPB52_019224 [Rhipicephalus sanguineus]
MHGNDSEAVGNDAERQHKSRFLDAFYKLADTTLECRVSGAETVIKELVKSSEESDSSDKLQYTIDRLIKGLPSTRKCARVGFAATLVEVLRAFPGATAEQVQACILKYLPEDTKENHVILARGLALAALVRSGKAVEVAGSVAKEVLDLGMRYSHLQLMACDIFKELLNQVNEKKFKKKVWPELQEMLSCGWEDCTPLKLYVLVQAASRFPGMVDGAFLQENWGCDSILDKANYTHIVQILQAQFLVEFAKKSEDAQIQVAILGFFVQP